jgi:hypothetical protein
MRFAQRRDGYGRFARQGQCIAARRAQAKDRHARRGGVGEDAPGLGGRQRQHITGLILSEQRGMGGNAARQGLDGRADAARHRHLGERDGETAVGQVVHRVGTAGADQAADEIAVALLGRKVDGRRRTLLPAFGRLTGLAIVAPVRGETIVAIAGPRLFALPNPR